MNPERLKKVEDLYHEVRLRPSDQRKAWLAHACADDHSLCSEVESLLAQAQQSDGLLAGPALEAGAQMISRSARVLTTGMKLGMYEIVEVAGTGGMGEVYRARDSRLKRDVAVKVLPQDFASDRDRVMRFEREAQILASLNHPNIGAIFGIDDSTGTPALILEYIPGDTLADRLKNGPIPLGETLAIAKQITDALQAAHEKGTVHRDLKPSNIKVSREGNVKLLDFGLAKVFSNDGFEDSADSRRSLDPTNTGIILGTAAYMSPEQAKGEEVDKQTDIWAFGCVLYEMLTGTPAFRGKTTTDIIASVLRNEPDWSLLNVDARHLQPLLTRCLEKSRSHRIHDMADAQILLEALASSVTVTKAQPVSRRKPILIAVAAGFLGIVALVILLLSKPFPEALSMRFIIPEPEQAVFLPGPGEPQPTVSPDGRRLVFRATDKSGSPPILWLRSFDNLEAQKLPGTDNGTQPFWSPDSRSVAFFAGGKLKRVDVSGGPAQTLADIEPFIGGSWSPDGKILLGQIEGGGGLREVSSTGGQVRLATKNDGSNERFHRLPQFLPDGRHFIYVTDPPWTAYVTSLDATDRKLLLRAESKVVYAQPGYLLFVRGGSLFAQKFDASRLKLTGQPFAIAENVRTGGAGRAAFSVSDNGMLVYRTGNSDAVSQLTWFDRTGKALGTVAEPGDYQGIDLSPDDQQVAVHRHEISGGDVWLTSLIRDNFTRFTFGSARHYTTPVWSRNGSQIAFVNDNGTQSIYLKAASGAGEDQVLFPQADDSRAASLTPRSFTPSGESLVYEYRRATSGIDLWMLPLTGNRKPSALLQEDFDEFKAQISPNGRWIAYTSNESGRDEVYVRPFPSVSAGKWQISTQGGDQPRWRRDGQEMFFMAQDRTLMAVEVKTRGAFEQGNPHALFRTSVSSARLRFDYAVSQDGQRFLINTLLDDQSTITPITVVANWPAGIAKK